MATVFTSRFSVWRLCLIRTHLYGFNLPSIFVRNSHLCTSCVYLKGTRNLLYRTLTLMPSYRPTLLMCKSNLHSTHSIDHHYNSTAGIYRGYHFSGPKTDNLPTEGPGSKTCNLPTRRWRSGDSYEHLYCSHTNVSAFKSHWLDVLTKSGIPEPDWSVKWITEHVQKISCSHSKGGLLSQKQLSMANSMMCERVQRIPVQYIIREWDFRNVTLSMKAPVFIPEPETEELVGYVLTHCCQPITTSASRDTNQPIQFIDLCCGSGAIAISLLVECPEIQGFAIDISSDSVLLTRQNAARNGVADRLTVLQGSVEDCPRLFANQRTTSSSVGHTVENTLRGSLKFDFIISNPPYIPSGDVPSIQPEVYRHVDHRALDGGEKGLDTVIGILSMCRHILKPSGQVWLETDLDHANDIHSSVATNPEWELRYKSTQADYTGRHRFHQLIRK